MFTNINSKSLLIYARANEYDRVKATLAKDYIDTNLQDEGGKTTLHWAVIHTDPFMTLIILNNFAVDGKIRENISKPDVNLKDTEGLTALHYLALGINRLKFYKDGPFNCSDNYIILELLFFEKEIDVNAQDNSGFTALHYGIANGNFLFAKELIERNANPFILNKFGNSILDYLNTEEYKKEHAFKVFLYNKYPNLIEIKLVDDELIICPNTKPDGNLPNLINNFNNFFNSYYNLPSSYLLGDNENIE